MRRRLVALVVLGALTCACGIPTSDQADVIPAKDVPFHLLSPKLPSTTRTTLIPTPTSSEPVYLVNGANQLIEAEREVVAPAELGAILDALLSGPTPAETAAGLSSALPSTVRVVNTLALNTTATIVLSPSFTSISGPSQTLAVGQLVLTVTSQPGISSVDFMVGSTFVPVPTASGASTTAPVTAADYASLRAP
jgi:spore germination protein GerM